MESEGVKILLLTSELAPALEGMVIDCQETPQGVRFTISELALAHNTEAIYFPGLN